MSHPAERRPLLAIDTSTTQAGIALYDGELIAELAWSGGRQGSQTLMPQIDQLLALSGGRIDDLAAVAVALGPGSFSALRVGLSVAKGLVLALGCALIGVPTLDVVAEPQRHGGRLVWAVLDAGRTRVVAAPYGPTASGWRAMAAPVHGPAAGLLECVSGPALVCGELPATIEAALAARPEVIVLSPALRRRRAGVLAELGWRRLQAGQVDNATTLEPLYLHGSEPVSRA